MQWRASGRHVAKRVSLNEIGPDRRNLLQTASVVVKEQEAVGKNPAVLNQVKCPALERVKGVGDTKLPFLFNRDRCSRWGT